MVSDKSIRFILNEELHAFVYLEFRVYLTFYGFSGDFGRLHGAGSDWAVFVGLCYSSELTGIFEYPEDKAAATET